MNNDDSSQPTYNILLMGETGTGKSTFINALLNYLSFTSLSEAKTRDLTYVIPTQFTITDENYHTHTIQIGNSENERHVIGKSATLQPKCHILDTDTMKIRLIDTPGLGDTSGTEQDNINFEMILDYITQFEKLNAICILLNPNQARMTIIFEYCIKHLLSRLEKSAGENIIFVFTNTRSTSYKPGETALVLRKLLDDTLRQSSYAKIPFSKQNLYCVDSEAFRYLAASKNQIDNLKFSDVQELQFTESWNTSSKECDRLLEYVKNLVPHKIQETLSINQARKLIMQLSQPLADALELVIQQNLTVLDDKKTELSLCTDQVEELKRKLSIPAVSLIVKEVMLPKTICTAPSCSSTYEVNGERKFHQPVACCNPCFLKSIPFCKIGIPELLFCSVMLTEGNIHEKIMKGIENATLMIINQQDSIICNKCHCSYVHHKHICYDSQVVHRNIDDSMLRSQLKTKEDAKLAIAKCIEDIEQIAREYENEQKVINETLALFQYFLRQNSIAPYNDAYEYYLEGLVHRETLKCKNASDTKRIGILKNILELYKKEKEMLEIKMEKLKESQSCDSFTLTVQDVIKATGELYNLKYCGPNIKEMLSSVRRSQQNAFLAESTAKEIQISTST